MKEEQKELYDYVSDHFESEIKSISKTCVSPLICIKKVVKKGIEKYSKDYCTNNKSPFSNEDFLTVSKRIYDELMSD